MLRFAARRLITLVPVMLAIAGIVFVMLRSAPGDVVSLIGPFLSPEEEAILREQLGLNRPLYAQFASWVYAAIQGDLGTSFFGQRSVTGLIRRTLPATIELTTAAMILALGVGIPAGVIAAYKRNTWFDRIATVSTLAGISFPTFWLGLVGIFVFSVKLGWLPASGRLSYTVELASITGLYVVDSLLTANFVALADSLRHLVLPAFVLGAVQTAFIARMTRSAVLEVLNENYVTVARAKGLRESVVLLRHALRNALVPIVTVVGLQIGFLLSGTIIVETVFAWPGLGRLVVDAVLARDYPVVLGVVLIAAITFALINLFNDMLYTLLDPRIRSS